MILSSGNAGLRYTVLDWFDRYTGGTWKELRDNNRLATGYANRRMLSPKLPKGDDVVVLVDSSGRTLAVHNTEIAGIVGAQDNG